MTRIETVGRVGMPNLIFIDRVWLWCATWSLVLVMVGISMLDGVSGLDVLVMLYAAAAIGSEFRGVRLHADHLAFPWRPVPGLPFLTVWRRYFRMQALESVIELAPAFGFARVRLKFRDGASTSLMFSGRQQQRAFIHTAMAENLTLAIFQKQ